MRGGGRERMLGVSMGMMKVKRTGGIGDSPDAERSSSFCGTWLRRCAREGSKGRYAIAVWFEVVKGVSYR